MIEYNARVNFGGRVNYTSIQSSSISYARNVAAQNMKGDWILMLDCDAQFDPDIAERMVRIMEEYNTAVLTGVYLYKKEPHYPVLYTYNKIHGKFEVCAGWQSDGKAKIFKIDGAGAGCLLIKRITLSYIAQELHEKPFDIISPLGEDMSFFDRLRRLKVDSWCDPSVVVEHLTLKPLVPGLDYNTNPSFEGFGIHTKGL
jgi:glycosyltransferase involved in cell wall biosynthesis